MNRLNAKNLNKSQYGQKIAAKKKEAWNRIH